jgi:hypothetical protein
MTPNLFRWLGIGRRVGGPRSPETSPPPESSASTDARPAQDAGTTTAPPERHRHVRRSIPEEWALTEPNDDGGLEAMLPPDDGF